MAFIHQHEVVALESVHRDRRLATRLDTWLERWLPRELNPLAHLGAGNVTDTEVGDEESYYEVEVTLETGQEIDVQLDRAFAVVSTDGNAE